MAFHSLLLPIGMNLLRQHGSLCEQRLNMRLAWMLAAFAASETIGFDCRPRRGSRHHLHLTLAVQAQGMDLVVGLGRHVAANQAALARKTIPSAHSISVVGKPRPWSGNEFMSENHHAGVIGPMNPGCV
jgi:hypothetical protein